MIEMLRPEVPIVGRVAEAPRWQHHTIRGANSGTLKKKLGLSVEATRVREGWCQVQRHGLPDCRLRGRHKTGHSSRARIAGEMLSASVVDVR
jgi:hypothetical protein